MTKPDLEEKRFELQKFIEKLESFSGSGTELISIYIPSGSQISDTSNKLKNEYGQASNIKSKSTRKNVQDALDKIIQYLKIFNEPPKNGLAIFCGNVSDNPSKVDIELFSLEPPFPLNINLYRCDSKFYLDPLKNMLDTQDSYGLVVMDGKEATLAMLKGTEIRVVKRLNSTAHSKIRKGGQSANRYARLIEESIEKYYQRIGEAMNSAFLGTDIKGILIGGPGPAKEDFVKMAPFNYQHKILGVVDTGYTDEQGIHELLEKSKDILEKVEIVEQKKVFERFMKELVKDGLVTYGLKEVLEALETKKAELIIISKGLNGNVFTLRCTSCRNEFFRMSDREELEKEEMKCNKCGSPAEIIDKKGIFESVVEKAREKDIDVKVISAETNEGIQFLKSFGGLGAFLRYK